MSRTRSPSTGRATARTLAHLDRAGVGDGDEDGVRIFISTVEVEVDVYRD
jgi:hypothetical protein